jgi:hypothetical protein
MQAGSEADTVTQVLILPADDIVQDVVISVIHSALELDSQAVDADLKEKRSALVAARKVDFFYYSGVIYVCLSRKPKNC